MQLKRACIIRTAIVVTVLFLTLTAHASVRLITQKEAGKNTCGPTALLYAFKKGRKDLRDAIKRLEGREDIEKLRSIIRLSGSKPSATTYHKIRLEPASGMAPADLFATANDLLTTSSVRLQNQNFSRKDSERKPGEFLKRVHELLSRSIDGGVPVTTIAVPYSAQIDQKTAKRTWSEHVGHYVVITRVSPISEDGRLGFDFDYLDPMTGTQHSGFIFEEITNPFWAREELVGGSRWIHHAVESGGRDVSSPYLAVSAPDLNLRPRNLEEPRRFVVTLVWAIGDFEARQ